MQTPKGRGNVVPTHSLSRHLTRWVVSVTSRPRFNPGKGHPVPTGKHDHKYRQVANILNSTIMATVITTYIHEYYPVRSKIPYQQMITNQHLPITWIQYIEKCYKYEFQQDYSSSPKWQSMDGMEGVVTDWLTMSMRWDVSESRPQTDLCFIPQLICERGQPWWLSWCRLGRTPDSSTRALWQSYHQASGGM
jgi:hypothetical protein